MSEESCISLLVVVLDTNPVWWGKNDHNDESRNFFVKCLNQIIAFANAHLTMSHLNKIAIIACHSNGSHFLYPRTSGSSVDFGSCNDGRHETLLELNQTLMFAIKQLTTNESNTQVHTDSLFAGAMGTALCYINKQEKHLSLGEKLSSRILVIKGSEDNPLQYMNCMSAVFTAQKKNVTIDACILDNDSGLLQQACDITKGIYLKVPQLSGLLQYLIWVFLPDPLHRDSLTLPPRVQVDYRAACFCHRNLISIGYVCSVCLSIFCAFSPICSTCQTTFKIRGPMKLPKKKIKKI